MEQQQINDIIEKYKHGIASPAELEQLNNWYRDNAYLDAEYPDNEHEVCDRIITRLNSKINPVQRRTKLWPRIAAAAAILLVAGAGLFFYTSYYAPRHLDDRRDPLSANDIAPGKIGATLTLANGKQISLSDAKNGELAKEAGVTITKNADGQLVYAVSSSRGTEGSLDHATSRDLSYRRDDWKAGTTNSAGLTNTLTTAKGETYQVRLPDGTLAWLNAASTLKYPASFTAHKNRRVELSGEGYFEVAKDKAHPFIVVTDKQEVEVLGTHFNVNSYADELSTKTSLLEGAVKINDKLVLKPGEQSILKGGKLAVSKFDPDKVIAWKTGKFVFDEEDIESIMRKLSRWYNVEVSYQGDLKDRNFTASISRFSNISKILDKLSYTNKVHFKIEGRRVIVTE